MSIESRDIRDGHGTYLSYFKTVVDLVLERTHLHLTDQFRLDYRLGHDEWHKFTKVRKDQVWFIVSSRVESRHSQTSNLHIFVLKNGE